MQAIILSLFFFVAYVIYRTYFDPLANVPGPRFAKLCPSWIISILWTNKVNYSIDEQHRKHGMILDIPQCAFLPLPFRAAILTGTGDVVRLGPTELSFSTISAHDTIYNTDAATFTTPGSIQCCGRNLIHPGLTFVVQRSVAEQKELRKIFAPAFRLALTGGIETNITNRFNELLAALDIRPGMSKCMNLTHCLEQLEWNLIGDLGLGQPVPDSLRGGWTGYKNHQHMIGAAYELGSFLLTRRGFPKILDIVGKIWPQILLEEGFLSNLAIKQRTEGKNTFVSQALPYKSEKFPLMGTEMPGNVIGIMVASYETSESTLRATLCALLSNPAYYKALQHEIRSTFSTLESITDSQLVGLRFLNGCVNEGLRLWPGLNGKFTSRLSTGGVIDGVYVPAGYIVSADLYSIQRNPKYWHEPDSFKPERWFDGQNKDELRAFRPFSVGPRSCPGRQMALQKVRLTLSKFAFSFDMEFVNPDFDWQRDVPSGFLWGSADVMVRISRSDPPQAIDERVAAA
ncbi:putative cytochrome P450 monooxygenase [Aspergillus clavatus NRRL 1]|uniref:Cytochrome P450 monooxygenase, putative n=1 Tax=Aspergillus clavatus (strain ATCC 1007 / CBS 513.65 / DSM 816 / NCTC 3887 / NRRL 1 / QM 1276 / 107) TaxID=344612 RepID=A1CLG3_ASPCL|nr:cytochrome P450 monooxygenase, putative [Aspergillus clavatus NRRL 1]EAW09987.1 cytochrome P450 monooxygenase, putative [Aspergillus clavatus NRRL 1]